ncbi:MAG TPA: prolyl oligopeptidase family serine peptidase [Humisphaera sp.]
MNAPPSRSSRAALAVVALFAAVAPLAGCGGSPSQPAGAALAYPPARRDAAVVDDYHGTKVPDPYRWLEDADSKETVAFVEAQNKLTAAYLAGPDRERFKARYAELYNFPKHTVPSRYGNRYFYSRNDGLQNQDVLYAADAPPGPGKVLLDPNTLSADGTVALSGQFFSLDGSLLCYALQSSGSDRETLHVLNTATGEKRPEALRDCKFTAVGWRADNFGFYYNRYPALRDTKSGEAEGNRDNKVYFHLLGTPQDRDMLVYERPDHPDWGFSPTVTEDGAYLVLHVWVGTDPKNRIYYRREPNAGKDGYPVGGGEFVKLLDDFDARYAFIGNVGGTFYFNTNLKSPKGSILAIDLAKPGRKDWRTVVPEQKDEVLMDARLHGGKLVLLYAKDAYHKLYVHDPATGVRSAEVPLPGIGAVANMSGRQQDDEMFLSFESFTAPPTEYRYEISSGKLTKLREPQVKVDTAQFESHQHFVTGKDGTRVPVFVVHKKGLKLDGTNPTLLYAYGGFEVSQQPWFSTGRAMWMENGGVWALACIRGGGEYGEAWHDGGRLDNKQNSFEDFYAAARWLCAEKYTSPKKLAINGGSNGGLLVAASVTQHPELFGAAVADVPVTDMLRFHKFTVGSFWVPEYGSSDDAKQFKTLLAYSPLHNVRDGTKYPPTLITSADADDRVVPMHAKKFAATLQHAVAPGGGPILLRVETKAGHGDGKPTSKVIDEQADFHAFLWKALGGK